MKKEYLPPVMEILYPETVDIVCASVVEITVTVPEVVHKETPPVNVDLFK